MTETQARERRVYIATFGCQMNEYDSERLMRLLSARGYRSTGDPAEADLIFLNTCSIREKAEQKVYSLLGRLTPLKADNPNLVIGVGGCVAQQQGARLLTKTPHLDIVVGTHGISRLPDLVDEVLRGASPVTFTDFDYDLARQDGLLPTGDFSTGIKAFLTIMQGCDNFCAYCVVPYVRGRETSRGPGEILEEARRLIAGGAIEITLLGQNVNSYGRGLDPFLDFTGLLRRVAALPGLERLRFTTSHPKDLSPELIRAMAELEPVCDHLHLPVQSGSTRMLSAMGRGYTRESYVNLVEALRSACPDLSLTTDVIVGFPGETEEDFEETLSLVHEVGFDGMFSFKYSDRPGTRASKMKDKVDDPTGKRRLAALQDLQKEITLGINRKMVGRIFEVLVEGPSGRYPGQLTGRTRTNKIVNFVGEEHLTGRLVDVLIEEAWANSLRGRLATSVPSCGPTGISN